eukprot:c21819_g1_i1 orf=78-992(+)
MTAEAAWRSLRVEGPGEEGVVHLILNRPTRSNALDSTLFTELPLAIARLDASPDVRVIILAGSGKNFCSGLDLSILASALQNGVLGESLSGDVSTGSSGSPDPVIEQNLPASIDAARANEQKLRNIKVMQAAFTSLEDCRKPIIAAIHGACIGGGVDLITACDLRYCSSDSFFSVKEVDLAIVADLGTLQRLPLLVGHGNAMDLALTGRRLNAMEAKAIGLVHDVFQSKDAMVEQVNALARNIAAKSPLAVIGTKRVLLKSRDLSVLDGLDYVATWNSGMLISSDLKEAIRAQLEKRKPNFSKL